ncbi:MAG: hypothetical protein EOS52_07245 [Mesorhizobium sp.]|uniref:hypothetical protein n=1 Tax=Mesorhizobium sp. TaxID=1871066 RepID=UPI000FE5F4B0|nr:hypothetical protein [Mesorhizobium sp.]RWC15940.1 MAG: hypothetical protein EOS52_07245 [Mesorhizobium sp.]
MLRAIGAFFRVTGKVIYHTARVVGLAIYYVAISIRAIFRIIEKQDAKYARERRRSQAETARYENAELRRIRLYEARRRVGKR